MKAYSKPKKFNHPRYKYYVSYPNPDQVVGGRKKAYFNTYLEAEAFSTQGNAQASSAGLTIATLSESARREYLNAVKLLEPYNISLLDAVCIFTEAMKELAPYKTNIPQAIKHFKKWNDIKEQSTTLERAFGLYLDALESEGKSEEHRKTQKYRLNRFVEDFKGSSIIGMIEPKKIEKWLKDLKKMEYKEVEKGKSKRIISNKAAEPKTKNNYRRTLSAFFSYCRRQDFIKFNPIEKTVAQTEKKEEPEIYSVEQMRLILNHTEENSNLRAYIALAAFAGLRPTEIKRLNWNNINLEDREITLSGKITKTGSRRIVKISDNLAAWLAPYALNTIRGGEIIEGNYYKDLKALFNSLKIKFIIDGFRHSAASYHLANSQNAAETAEQMGHSVNVLKTNYKGLVRGKDIKAYWNITPAKGAVIINAEKLLKKSV